MAIFFKIWDRKISYKFIQCSNDEEHCSKCQQIYKQRILSVTSPNWQLSIFCSDRPTRWSGHFVVTENTEGLPVTSWGTRDLQRTHFPATINLRELVAPGNASAGTCHQQAPQESPWKVRRIGKEGQDLSNSTTGESFTSAHTFPGDTREDARVHGSYQPCCMISLQLLVIVNFLKSLSHILNHNQCKNNWHKLEQIQANQYTGIDPGKSVSHLDFLREISTNCNRLLHYGKIFMKINLNIFLSRPYLSKANIIG